MSDFEFGPVQVFKFHYVHVVVEGETREHLEDAENCWCHELVAVKQEDGNG